MTTTADDRLFAYLKTRLEGDATITASKARITRDDWADDARRTYPKIEYNPFRYRGEDTYAGEFALTIHFDRGDAYGVGNTPAGQGELEALEAAVIARLAGQRPTGMTGFAVSTIEKNGRRRPTIGEENYVSRRIDYGLSIIPGGAAVPHMGTDADLTSAGINGRAVSWQFNTGVDLSIDGTRLQDVVPHYKASRPQASGTIDILPTDTKTPFPAAGSSVAITLQTHSGTSWTDTMLIRSWDWIRRDGLQLRRLSVVVTNADSPFFGRTLP